MCERVDISDVRAVGRFMADAEGRVRVIETLELPARDDFIQAIDIIACVTSQVVAVE